MDYNQHLHNTGTLKPDDEEAFKAFETKIDEVTKILQLMNSDTAADQQTGMFKADQYLGHDSEYAAKMQMDDFIVRVKEDRTVINKNALQDAPLEGPTCDQRVFMAEMEKDAERRHKDRVHRDEVAQNLRKQGNLAFSHKLYERAVTMYTKALDQVKDSAVMYNNRALSYIRLGLYKRAIIDCDFVIKKLDEKNLRAWMYRAYGYHELAELDDFHKSVTEAKKANPKELDYIEQLVGVIQKSTVGDVVGCSQTAAVTTAELPPAAVEFMDVN